MATAGTKTWTPPRIWPKGYEAEGGGSGADLHVRETMLIDGLSKPPKALVVMCFWDEWITTVELWED